MSSRNLSTSYSVILPTYNEYDNLRILIPQLVTLFESTNRTYEIIVVDDDSNDGTSNLIEDMKREVTGLQLISRTTNRGLATAIIDGTSAAKFPTIIHMDADLAHTVSDLGRMITHYEEAGDDNLIVVGSRYQPGSRYEGKSLVNRIAGYLGLLFVRCYLKIPVKDSSNNFRIFRKSIWDSIRDQLITDGNIMLVQFLYLAIRNGCNVSELPISYSERTIGQSKLSVRTETLKFFTHIFKDFRN